MSYKVQGGLKMKRFICTSLAAMMLMTSAVFADTTANVYIGDKLVSYSDQTPVIIDSRTYVPIRDVFETAGFKVDWNAETKSVTLSNDYHNIMLYTQTNSMLSMDTSFNIKYKKLDNPVKIVNNRTLLPLREILESADYSLDWDAETKSAKVKDNNDYVELKAKADKLESMFNEGTKKYEFDASKPAGEFTEEEYAFLDNMFSVLKEMKESKETISGLEDINDISPESAKIISSYMRKYTSKFSAVKCPESLDNMDKKMQNIFNTLVDNIISMSQFAQDNPDNGEDAFSMVFALMLGVAAQASEAVEPLQNICEERNIDMQAVFGDKYTAEELSNIVF